MILPSNLTESLQATPRPWLITGGAGFIGSNLVQGLLECGQTVRCMDNLSTGTPRNLEHVQSNVTAEQWARFEFVQGDIRDATVCRDAVDGVAFVIHQAAMASVPLSMKDPVQAHEVNVTGTHHLFLAAKDAGVERIVYASSSAVYGDATDMPLTESAAATARLLSPYAAHKRINEVYAETFRRCYGLESVGLRYFNVFGPRQDPNGAYAAVIPQWISSMIEGQRVHINGDGETSRDFCYVGDVVQANLLAATADLGGFEERVFNVGLGERTTLNELYGLLVEALRKDEAGFTAMQPEYRDFRAGDVRHSQADIGLAVKRLGFAPKYTMEQGLVEAMGWYRGWAVGGRR